MPDVTTPMRVKVDGPGGLAAAVPHLLGFHPRESLVLVALQGPRRRVVFQLRVDLSALPECPLHQLVGSLVRAQADEAVVLVYTESACGDGLPHPALVADLDRLLDEAGVRLTDALAIRSGRWRSYLCTDEACCPPSGTPLPAGVTDAEVAAAVQLGQVTLSDRSALAESIAPYGGIAGESMQQAVDRAFDALAGALDDDTPVADVWAELGAGGVRAFDAAVSRYADPPAKVSHDEAARMLVGLVDIAARDEIARRCMDVSDDAFYALLHDLCRLAPVDVASPVYTLLGAAAYARGKGALAAIAFERALDADPGYSLARLLDDALRQQIPPALLRKTWAPPGRRAGARAGKRRR